MPANNVALVPFVMVTILKSGTYVIIFPDTTMYNVSQF